MMNSAEFICICGKMKGWVTEGQEHPNHCPVCGRRYKGEYDPKNLTIKAVEVQWDKVDEFIKETLEIDCFNSKPIEWFSVEELDELAERAKKENMILSLHAEHSNVHQGVLVNLIKRDKVDNDFIRFL